MSVLLKKSDFEGITTKELAQQIEAKKKCADKLPTWYTTPKIYYPSKLNIEQASSETTARYKAKIVSGKSLLDMTGGLGVDSYFFSKKIEHVSYCEIDKELAKIATHNFKILRTQKITTLNADGIAYLKKTKKEFDWLYIDPSRRNKVKGKVFLLSDCLPPVPEHLELFFSKSKNILIKTSPLLDISAGIKELLWVKEIHVVAVHNEVKELLWVLEHGFTGDPMIRTIDLKKGNDETFDFPLSEEKSNVSIFSGPLAYLFEPNTAIMKSGAFKTVGSRLGLKKLHEHTHLYTSNRVMADFPGRGFKIKAWHPYNKRCIKNMNIEKANITTRNFPESVAAIRKKFKIKEGGGAYLFFTKDMDEQLIVIQCARI